MEAAFRLVRNQGGLCVLAGNLPAGGRISLDPFDLIRGKRIIGTWGGETRPDRDIPRYVDLCVSGRWQLSKMITHTFALEEVNEALSALEQGKVGRAVLDMRQAKSSGR
jgi:S-(hydroxymethyl)glutathione dehydrogenase / alcohol dehydrogenase